MENLGPLLLGVIVLFFVVTWSFVSLRCFIRIKIVKSFGVDDYLMVLSLIVFTVTGTFSIFSIHYGLGKHNSAVDFTSIMHSIKYQLVADLSYIGGSALIRLSIGMLLLRIAPFPIYRYITWTTMAVMTLWTVVTFFILLFQCHPISLFWDRSSGKGTCISPIIIQRVAYAFSGMGIVFDWMFALLPVPMLWNVKMSTKLKGSIFLVLILGIFASVATIVRFKFFIALVNFNDELYTMCKVTLWSIIESGIGITLASMVAFQPLLKRLQVPGFSDKSNSQVYKIRETNYTSNRRSSIGQQYATTETTVTHTDGPSRSNNSREFILNKNSIREKMEVDISYELNTYETPAEPSHDQVHRIGFE